MRNSLEEVSEDDLLVFYGENFNLKGKTILIKRSEQAIELFEKMKAYDEIYTLTSIHFVNLTPPMIPEKFGSFSLPVFFKTGEPVFEIESEDFVKINFDIFSCAFYFLTSWDERIKQKKDDLGRFPDAENLIAKIGLANFPIVNLYFYILKFLIEKAGVKVEERTWNGRKFAICLTHDIDVLKKWSAYGVYNETMNKFIMGNEDIQKRRERFAKFIYLFFKGVDPYRDGMKKIFEFENEMGVKSTFFLKSGGNSKYDARYKWDEFLIDFVKKLREADFEIGFHPSFNTFDKIEMMRTEKEQLEDLINFNVDGVRQHYLRYDFKITPFIHDKLGFRYDSTLGFSSRHGFRSGYSFPYKIYDIEKNVEFGVWEIPIVFMDSVYQYGKSLKSVEEIFSEIINLMQIVESFGGVMTVLFHNTIYDEFDFNGWDRIYEDFLRYAVNSGAFVSSCNEILDIFERE
ncbi:MAG: polysaccharide deacetylase family protein [Candidatus Kryptonium sp.]